MDTILLNCKCCPRRHAINAPDPKRGWNLALSLGWAKQGKSLLCPAENPARVEYAQETRTHA